MKESDTILAAVRAELEKPVLESVPGLKTILAGSLRLREPILSLRVERYKDLCKKREQYRHPKDKEYTDFDRKVMLEALIADVTADYEIARGLEDALIERIQIIKTLLELR